MKTDCTFGTPEPGCRYHDRTGAYLIAEHAGSIALIQTPKGYFLPGGGMEPSEDPQACIRRELLEETGYTVRITGRVATADAYERHPMLGWFHPIQHYYAGELVEQVAAPSETDHTLVWKPLPEAEVLLLPECQRWAVSHCAGAKKWKGSGDAP